MIIYLLVGIHLTLDWITGNPDNVFAHFRGSFYC